MIYILVFLPLLQASSNSSSSGEKEKKVRGNVSSIGYPYTIRIIVGGGNDGIIINIIIDLYRRKNSLFRYSQHLLNYWLVSCR